ncbi:FecR/PupR family sigma factor regulator [Asticcacaulis solisilvae]|uniref:FecR/PupR family sigma factor regulator n=1 Tax=Asticcacaulis solisilvae TaxID=1217274 RepID=UPI003FD7D8BC
MNTDDLPPRKRIIDEAATWYAELDSGVADVREFEVWRDSDPRHAVAFAQIVGTVSLLDKVKDGQDGEHASSFVSQRMNRSK